MANGPLGLLKPRNSIYRLAIAGVFVLLAFRGGTWAFIHSRPANDLRAQVKDFSSLFAEQKSLSLIAENKKIAVPAPIVQNWLETYERAYTGRNDVRISSDKLKSYLLSLAADIDTEPTNARFEMENGRAKVFLESVPGKKINIQKSEASIIQALVNKRDSAGLTITKMEPAITLAKINGLGISALLGRGESDYGKSSPARIQNIKMGSSKISGVIVKPGDEFSFNSFLGEIDGNNGFEQELVIKNGELVPEYGGGICQVSTTLFRAAILAGLPITERKPHSFPVKYYNPQGFDATIYPGVTDLKFVNNTPAHILIQGKVKNGKVIFEIYGTSDERTVNMDGPYQYDEKPSGSMKAYFVRKISYADGTAKEERFDSVYKPPMPLARNPLE